MTFISASAALTTNDERFLQAYRRIRAFKTRPTTIAAQEFFGSSPPMMECWQQSLPQRLQRLCDILTTWVRL